MPSIDIDLMFPDKIEISGAYGKKIKKTLFASPKRNITQESILLALKDNSGELPLNYAEIARIIRQPNINLQNVKYHLNALHRRGAVSIHKQSKKVTLNTF